MPMILKQKNNSKEEIEEYQEFSVSYSEEKKYDGTLFRWSAPEHEPYTVGKRFYLFSTLFLTGLIIYALVSDSPIMAITFILIGIVGYIFLQKEPKVLDFSINYKGIIAGNEIYEFENLKSFWIFYDPPYEKILSLRSKGSFAPYIHIPVNNADPVRIREILINFIPEVKQEHNLVDTVERFLHM